MRKVLPAFLGLALTLGVGFAGDKQVKEKVKVEKDGDMKIKTKRHIGDKKVKTETKVDRHDDGSVTVKSKKKVDK